MRPIPGVATDSEQASDDALLLVEPWSGLPGQGCARRDAALEALAATAPEKIHVSIHDPDDAAEVERVPPSVKKPWWRFW